MLINWPGHHFPPHHYETRDECLEIRSMILAAGHELLPSIPGFSVSCVPDGPELLS